MKRVLEFKCRLHILPAALGLTDGSVNGRRALQRTAGTPAYKGFAAHSPKL